MTSLLHSMGLLSILRGSRGKWNYLFLASLRIRSIQKVAEFKHSCTMFSGLSFYDCHSTNATYHVHPENGSNDLTHRLHVIDREVTIAVQNIQLRVAFFDRREKSCHLGVVRLLAHSSFLQDLLQELGEESIKNFSLHITNTNMGSTIGTNLSPNVLLAFTTGTTNCSTNLSYQSRLFAGCAGAGFAGSGAEFKV